MRFWDASAIVPLLVEEKASAACRRAIEQDTEVVVWWGTPVECSSALGRREREGDLDAERVEEAFARLVYLREAWAEVHPVDGVRTHARRLLRVHPLRTAAATQLAASVVCSEGDPRTLPFVCLDRRLAAAARREGFSVVEPA